MRKDVKLGLAVGVVLFAVLIIYLLSSSKPEKGAELATNSGEPVAVTPGAGSAATPSPGDAAAPAPAPVTSGAVAVNDPGAARPEDVQQPYDWSSAFGRVVPASAASSTPVTGVAEPGPRDTGISLTVTPMPAAALPVTRPAHVEIPVPAPGSPVQVNPVERRTPEPAVQPVGRREHIVQRGETPMTIAAAAYGNGNYYPHILRANPGLNPNALKIGQKIILPAREEVVPANVAAVAPATQPASLDAARQYRVQQNDNLYTIARKLYGKASFADKIYEANKQLIGADPAHLRINMVLQLPEAPTQSVQR